jgi:hypothetical protein
MRSEEAIREQLQGARDALSGSTNSLSKGRLDAFDFTGVAGTVGIIQALEWVMEESDELNTQINPLKRPIEDV